MNKSTNEAIEGEIVKTSKPKVVKSYKKSDLPLKQRKFINNYTQGETMGNGTKSAIKAGYAEGSAHVSASRLLKSDKVLTVLNDSITLAEDTIKSLVLSADSDAIRLAASREVLDRTIGKPIQRSINAHVNISVEDMLNS